MSYNIPISILILILIFTQVFLLGKYFCVLQGIFKDNGCARFIVGIILYFGSTFIIIFPFIWLKLDVLYYVIIYFTKEFIVFAYLFIRFHSYGINIKYKTIVSILISSVAIAALYNYAMNSIISLNPYDVEPERFNIINIFVPIIKRYSLIDFNFIVQWIFGCIGGAIIFASVNALFIELMRKNSVIMQMISFLVAFGLMFLLNFGSSLIMMSSLFLLSFGILLSMKILVYMRRRYAVIMGILIIVAWTLNNELFFADLSLAIITIFAYTYYRKPKPEIFTVQLIVPVILIASIGIYPFSIPAALGLSTVSIIAYILILFSGRIKMLRGRLLLWNNKMKKYFIYLFILAYVISSIVFIVKGIEINKLDWFNNAITNAFSGSRTIISYLEIALWAFSLIMLLSLSLHWKRSGKVLKQTQFVLILMLFLMVLFFNPLWNILADSTLLKGEFKYLKGIFIIPFTLSLISRIPLKSFSKKLYFFIVSH